MARYIDIETIVDFITKGLNDPDKTKAFGYDAVEILAEIEHAPTANVVPVSEVFRLIAGHSNYHGDRILAALGSVAEGKEVKPIIPLPDVAKVRHGQWIGTGFIPSVGHTYKCSQCIKTEYRRHRYCPYCGAKMDELESGV